LDTISSSEGVVIIHQSDIFNNLTTKFHMTHGVSIDSSYTILYIYIYIYIYIFVVLNKQKASLPNDNLYKNSETFGLLDSQLFNVKEVVHVLFFLPCKCA
jgi:hypothetical protein